ncbi:response regulator [Candidatus Protochlamydia phocaeensis]|uniref:response regulator n=1 Tax=Candidatus Protochlamydia phocaeensis TaxID=1414722 RepID=UPI000837ECC9|nr:response regulator [Candidatus Protochlamydia phocaeensis]
MANKPLKKIIIADDEENILDILKYCMEDLPDVEVHYLGSGQEALQDALTFQPDLIILDFMMPGMDGQATLQALRLIPSLSKIPVVFLTAKVQKNEIDEFIRMGASNVIAKPFDPMTLAETIKNEWERINSQAS